MKLSRLSGRKINEYVMRKGGKWNGKTMTIKWLPGAPASARRAMAGRPKGPNYDPAENALYVGTYAPIKLHKSAVKRNRMRRRVREAWRRVVKEMPTCAPSASSEQKTNGASVDRKKIPTMQLLIAPRSSSLTCEFADIENDVRAFISTVS